MIRPYITILKDSFHEAFASRVLWILLVVSTLLLCALVPLALREQRASQLRLDSVRDWPALVTHISQDAQSDAASPGKRIWQLAGDDFRRTITDATRKEKPEDLSRDMVFRLLGELNKVLQDRKLYDKASWAGVELDQKTLDLVQKGIDKLSQPEVLLLNRQLLKAAFPAEIANVPDEELVFSYWGHTIGSPLPVSRKLAEPIISQVLGQVMNFFVGAIGVFVAILVTAPIIPQMFEAGAIDLLLSKPVARPLVFLVKFFGGCAFILLNGGYFIVGLWAIMGFRFGLWNNSLLLCIPLFLFLFAIYYSVSAFAAVLWKNSIVSIVITILFWAACFTVGSAKGIIEQLFVNPTQIVNVVPAGDSLLVVNQTGDFQEWRAGAWETVMKPQKRSPSPFAAGPVLVGPVYDPVHKRLLYMYRSQPRRFGLFGPSTTLMEAVWSGGSWKQTVGPTPPAGASWLFLGPQDEVITVTASGVFRLQDQEESGPKETKILGFTIPTGGSGPYEALGPKPPLKLSDLFSAAMDAESGDLVVYSSGTVLYLRRDKTGHYVRGPEHKLEDAGEVAALALAGKHILVAQQDGRVLVLGADDLKTQKTLQPAGKSEPYVAAATPNGRWFAVLFHDGKLALLDAEGNVQTRLGGAISAMSFEGNDKLLVADRTTRLTEYRPGSLEIASRRQPALDALQATYRYVILPFYTVFPKPGELGNVVNYVLTDQKTVVPDRPTTSDLRQARQKLDIAGPIYSSLAFIAVMLAISCYYVSRADF